MGQVVSGNTIKLNSGKTVQAQQGGWYDGQQFWGGTLSQPGQINTLSNQPGAGQLVSNEVIAQTNPANVAYIQAERQKAGLAPSPAASVPAAPAIQPIAQAAPQAQPTPQPTLQPTPIAPSVPGGATTGVTGIGQPTIELPRLYEGLYAGSGIRDIEADLSAKTSAYNTQVAKIKDNPYLSEATMTGRIKKLEEKFSADTANIKNDIAMKKADIETQLNLQTKQFDINSNQAKLAWDQFNTLLSAGSLNNATGEDIAALTRATGISSSMIQSAIGVSKEKNKPKVNTQVISFDDGTNVGFAVVNQDTGDIINKQIIGKSKPKEPKAETQGEKEVAVRSKATQLLEKYKNSYGHVDYTIWQQILAAYMQDGGTRDDFIKNFGQYTDPNRDDFETTYGFNIDKR